LATLPDYFSLFELEPDYFLDGGSLAQRYRELQQQYHPDRFATASAQERRLAVQKASLINQAFDTLKTPVKKAAYLLALKGVDVEAEKHITSDTGFLMEQLALREQLQALSEKADPFDELEQLRSQTEAGFAELERAFAGCWSSGDLDNARQVLAKMLFFSKFLHQIEDVEAELD
jgi:molecular chaperone HscB